MCTHTHKQVYMYKHNHSHAYINTAWIPPAAEFRLRVCPVANLGSLSAHMLAPGHRSPQIHRPTSVAGTDHHTNMHKYINTQLSGTPLDPSSRPHCGLALWDTHTHTSSFHFTYWTASQAWFLLVLTLTHLYSGDVSTETWALVTHDPSPLDGVH